MSGISKPLVSLLIPTYNGEKFIRETLKSALKQSMRNLEIIVMDDDSKDNTLSIVQEFSDPRIRIFARKDNVGAQANWNRGVDEIRGKYFKLLPQDDLMATDCLAKQVAILDADKNEEIALVFSSRQVIGPKGDIRMVRGFGRRITGKYGADDLVRSCILSGSNLIGEPGSGLFRSALIKKIGPYSSEFPYVIDMDYWFRVLEYGSGFYISEPLTSFRVSANAWSVQLGRKQIVDYAGLTCSVYESRKFGLTRYQMYAGIIRSRINSTLRLMYYKLFL